jgi:hypothetical protein
MCSSACKRARPGTPCYCNCRGSRHGIYRGRRWARYPSQRPVRYVWPRPYEQSPGSDADERQSPIADFGRDIIKSAAIGVTCLALPAACPAITALGTIDSVWGLARDTWQQAHERRGWLGSSQSNLGAALAEEVSERGTRPLVQFVSNHIAAAIPTSGLPRSVVQTLASSTLSTVVTGAAGNLAHWAISNG